MKFIYSILLALLWVGITITLGSYLYRMGLPVVNASAQKLLLRKIDEDLIPKIESQSCVRYRKETNKA